MKTKQANKLLVLIISVMMIATLLVGMSVTASAEGSGATTDYTAPAANEAKIYGANVNLGGDISMKYYVELGDDVAIDTVKLRTVFLGVEKYLTAAETPVVIDNRTLYVFTLDSITPQCMGDDIDAELYIDEDDVDNMLDYSVKDNLVSIYDGSNDATKQLIIDTLVYGAASQTFRDYKTGALVTDGVTFIPAGYTGKDVPESHYENTGSMSDIYVYEATVNFSTSNLIKIQYQNGPQVLTAESEPIAAYDFAKKYTFSVQHGFTLKYSINDFCYGVISNEKTSDTMKSLAKALYNYGLSAHIVKGNHEGGTATCYAQAVCTICGNGYGDMLPHTYNYTTEATTITESCGNQNCNHNKTITLKVPENLVYDGNAKVAIVEGALDVAYELSYNVSEPIINAGAYTAILSAGGKSVELTFTIEKAEATITTPPTAKSDLTYNSTAQELIAAGVAAGGDMVYSLTENGDFTGNIPTRTNAGDYTVWYYVQGDNNHKNSAKASVTVKIAKADPTYTEPTGLTANLGQTLADVVLTDGWAWVDSTLSVGAEGENEFNAIFTPTDTNNYNTVTKALTVKVSKSAATVATAPAAVQNLEYTGAAQALVTAGAANGGTVQYKLGANGTYSTTIPTATDVGEYTVYWKVVGDSNHSDTTEKSITVSISVNAVVENEVTVGDLQASYTYTGGAIEPVITVTVGNKALKAGTDYTVTYKNNVYVGTATVTITFKGNYNGEITKTFEITQDPKTTKFDGEWVTIQRTDE